MKWKLTHVNKAFCSEGDIEVLTKGLTDDWIKVDKYWMYLLTIGYLAPNLSNESKQGQYIGRMSVSL